MDHKGEGAIAILGIVFAFGAAGCAMQIPLSETVMVEEPTYGLHFSGVGLSYKSVRLPSFDRAYAEPLETAGLSVASGIQFGNRVGYAISSGAAIGTDITVAMSDRVFASGLLSLGGAEGVLHATVVTSESFVTSIGLAYTAEIHSLYDRSLGPFDVFPDTTIVDKRIGPVVNLFVFDKSARVYGRIRATIGYSMSTRHLAGTVGVSMGVRWSRGSRELRSRGNEEGKKIGR